MRDLRAIISSWASRAKRTAIPTTGAYPVSGRQEPPALIQQMDAGKIMGILTAAEGGYTRDLFALYRDIMLSDSHLQAEFAKRKLVVLSDTLSYIPCDKANPDDVSVAKVVKLNMEAVAGWRESLSHLLDATLWPVSVVEKVYRPTQTGFELSALIPVPHHLLNWASGKMEIFDVDINGTVLPTRHNVDPTRYIVHHGHLLSMPDNWGGPFRSILFWWLLASMSREWWARFLERYGAPFLVGKYDSADGKNVLERAFSLATRLGGLVIDRNTEVEIKQAAASDSGQAFQAFLSICNREKSKLVIGQSLSSEAQSTGMNSGNAGLAGDVLKDFRKFDCITTAATIRKQIIVPVVALSGMVGVAPKPVFASMALDEADQMMSIVSKAFTAGLEAADPGVATLSELTGIAFQRRQGGGALPATFSAQSRMPGEISAEALRIIISSRSKDEAVSRLQTFIPGLPLPEISRLVEDAVQMLR